MKVNADPTLLKQLLSILLDNACAKATGGMGLGLSIARTIVQLHAGTIMAKG